MFNRYREFIAPVIVEGNPEQTRVAALLNRLLLMSIYIAAIISVIGPFIFPVWYAPLVVLVALIGTWFLARWLSRLGYLKYFSMGLVSILWIGTTGLVHVFGGLDSSPHALSYVTVVLVAGMLLGIRGTIIATLMSIFSLGLVVYLTETGRVVPVIPDNTSLDEFFIISSNLVVAALFLILSWRSQQQAMQKEHKLAEEAIRANRYKTDLLAHVSHELRTPLGAILGLSDMLESGAVGEMSEEQKGIFKKVVYNAEYLQHLLTELLEQSHIDSGKLAIRRVSFSPQEVSQRVGAGLEIHAREKGLALSLLGAEILPPALLGDPERLTEVFTNLIGNAIRYTEHGSVTVQASLPDPHHWQVDVRDTGVGIPSELQDAIFEPFRQLGNDDNTRKHGGVGLGLSISKQLVELMGGELLLESQVGVGSVFTVRLPLETPTGEA